MFEENWAGCGVGGEGGKVDWKTKNDRVPGSKESMLGHILTSNDGTGPQMQKLKSFLL